MHKLFNIGLQYFAEQSPATGGKVQEVADPVAEIDTDIGDEEFDDDLEDEDIDESDDEDDIDEDDPEDDEGAPADKGQKQNPQQNAAYAEIRRKAEADAKIKAEAEAKRMVQAEVDKVFADMGLKDPYTGKVIATKAEYEAFKARRDSETITKELGKAGISQEAINAIIASHPDVQKAQKAVADFEAAQRNTQEQAARVRLDEQIKEISALDPAVKTAADLAALPEYGKIREYVQKGISIVEAYKLTNMDKLTDKKTAAATQSAINKVASKGHLTPSASRGSGDAPVPKKVIEQYRMLNPGMTDKEIRADYAKFSKKYMKG